MKEITGKQKTKSSSLRKAMKTKKGITKKEILQKNLANIPRILQDSNTSKISIVTKGVSEYLPQCNALMVHEQFSFHEFKKAFKVVK